MDAHPDKKSLYGLKTVGQAKALALNHLREMALNNVIEFGLPEVDDRYHIWRVPLKNKTGEKIGEIVIDAVSTFIRNLWPGWLVKNLIFCGAIFKHGLANWQKGKTCLYLSQKIPGGESSMLEEKFRRWEEEFYQNGMLAGEAKGLAQQKTTLLEMLADRFEGVPDSWKKTINSLSESAAISQLTRQIYKVPCAEEYESLLKPYMNLQ